MVQIDFILVQSIGAGWKYLMVYLLFSYVVCEILLYGSLDSMWFDLFFRFFSSSLCHQREKYETIQWKKKRNKENTSKNEGDMRNNADRVIEIY